MQDFAGFILPPFIDLINRNIANSKVRFWISMFACVAVAVVLNLDKLNNFDELLGKASLIFAQAQIVYKTYWEKSRMREKMVGDI